MSSVTSLPGAPDLRRLDVDARRLPGSRSPSMIVQHDMLEDQHRVRVVAARRRSMPRASSIVAGREHAQARDVRVPALQAVRMLRGDAAGRRRWPCGSRAARRTGRRTCAECVAALLTIWSSASRLKLHGHDLDDRPHARHRRADPGADETPLSDSGVSRMRSSPNSSSRPLVTA